MPFDDASQLLLEEGYIIEDDCRHEGKEIRESGRKFRDQKYRSNFETGFNSIGDWCSAMRKDHLTKGFRKDWAQVTRDLLFDNDGSLMFKSGLWSDIGSVIVLPLVDKVRTLT